MRRDKDGKPILRHCQNCKWSGENILGACECKVKYQHIYRSDQRLKALLCRHYERKED